MKSTLKFVAGILVFLLFIGGVIAWNVSIWRECRAEHSWGYCMRLISK